MTQKYIKSQFKRVGPKPLGLHTALLIAKSLPKNEEKSSSQNDWESLLRKTPAFKAVEAMKDEAVQKFFQGVEFYRKSEVVRTATPCDVVEGLWQESSVQLQDFGGEGEDILLIPSLINPAFILDFNQGVSLVQHLKQQGFHVWMLDWRGGDHDDTQSDESLSLEKCIDFYINHSVNYIAKSGGSINILGYCMGGLLALSAAYKWPDKISKLALVATPWDFSKTESSAIFKQMSGWLELYFSAHQEVSADMLQSVFVAQDPLSAIQRFSTLVDIKEEGQRNRLILIEDWLSSGEALEGHIAREIAFSWYIENQTFCGKWRVGEDVIVPEKLKVPTLVVSPISDKLVPQACSLPLAEKITNACVYEPSSGHVGVMVGRQSGDFYQYLSNWFNK